MTNKTSLNTEGTNIQDESWREYVYPDGSVYRINSPYMLWIFEGKSGWTQRILDTDGVTHRPQPGWLAIRWEARPGHPAWSF